VMEAVLVRNGVNAPRIESLFETDLPYLAGAAPVPAFTF
jgi:protein-L-isoaspartate(D-aspartate) O-methyltransferase